MNETTGKNRLPPRLNRPSEFRRVRSNGRRYKHAFLMLIVDRAQKPRPNRDSAGLQADRSGRVGFVVPFHVHKRAVKRNRIRRLLREAVRLWWRFIEPGHDLVLHVFTLPKEDRAGYVERIFLKLLIRADVLTDEGKKLAQDRISELRSGAEEEER